MKNHFCDTLFSENSFQHTNSNMSRARQNASSLSSGPPPPPPSGPPPTPIDVEMNEGSSSSSPITSGVQSTLQGVDNSFQLMQLRQRDIICEHMDADMLNKKGIILQYLNSNSSGSTTMIGVTRIGLADPRRMPAYVSRNVSIIRQHAVAALQRHFKLTLCSSGVAEVLCPEDYSISFSWASLTEQGRSLTQHGKPDLALGYAACDGLLAPIHVSHHDAFPVCVLNVYVYLQDASRRSNAVLKKLREEEAAKANPPPTKKYQRYDRNAPQVVKLDDSAIDKIAEKSAAKHAENMKRAAPVSFEGGDFPPLHGGSAPEWNRSGVTSLPSE